MRAFIADEKIRRYLLNTSHPDGRSKARWLIAHGFRPDEPDALAEALIDHLRLSWPQRSTLTAPHGRKHVVEGPIVTPSGVTATLRSVWRQDAGSDDIRLITANPA